MSGKKKTVAQKNAPRKVIDQTYSSGSIGFKRAVRSRSCPKLMGLNQHKNQRFHASVRP